MNVTNVIFSGFYKTQICGLYQYDYGQVLKFTDITLPSTYEVHFAQTGATETVTVLGNADGVQIPDQYLLADLDIKAYIYLHEEETDGETVYQVLIPVIARPEPTDVEPTPVEQDIITQTIAALNSAVDTAEDYAAEASQSAASAAHSVSEAQAWAEAAEASAESIDTSSFATKQALTNEVTRATNAETEIGRKVSAMQTEVDGAVADASQALTAVGTETDRATSAENALSTRISTNSTAIGALQRDMQTAQSDISAETQRATQAESSISASIPTSAQISALAPVQSVNGQTGAVTLPTATTSSAGLMSSQDKSRLDDLYADYSSALSALGV